MTTAFVNQAHNDWIEVFVEYGILALAPMAVAAILIFRGAQQAEPASRYLFLSLVILLAASLVDYPCAPRPCRRWPRSCWRVWSVVTLDRADAVMASRGLGEFG